MQQNYYDFKTNRWQTKMNFGRMFIRTPVMFVSIRIHIKILKNLDLFSSHLKSIRYTFETFNWLEEETTF